MTATPLTMDEQGDHHRWKRQLGHTGDEYAGSSGEDHREAGGEDAAGRPALRGAAGDEPEHHEPQRVQPEREGVALRGEPVHALQDEGGSAEVGEDGGVGEAGDEDRAQKDLVGEESAEHAHAVSQPASVSSGRWQRLPQHTSAGREDEDADGGEEHERPAPVGELRELAADHGADDGGQTGQDGEAAVVAQEPATGEQVATGGLGDDDADRAGQPLHETGCDEGLDGRGDRAQHGGSDVGGYPDQERPPSPEPVGQRPGNDLPEREPEQARGHRQLRSRRARAEVGREGG